VTRNLRSRLRWLALLVASVAMAACGDSPSSPSPPNEATVSITASGVTPTEVRIPVGGRVTFTNNDIRAHAMSSDPIQTHTDCPAINEVGMLNPGQSKTTGVLDVRRACGFHDHVNETDPRWKGQIVVQ
jgi:plastocyanin